MSLPTDSKNIVAVLAFAFTSLVFNHAVAADFTGIHVGAGVASDNVQFKTKNKTDNWTAVGYSAKGYFFSPIIGGGFQFFDKAYIGADFRVDLSHVEYEDLLPDSDIRSRFRKADDYKFLARIGFLPAENTLLYLTGGIPYTLFKLNTEAASVVRNVKNWRGGWSAGAGIEHKLLDRWGVRFDYLHSDYKDYDATIVDRVDGSTDNYRVNPTNDQFTISLVFSIL